MSGIDPADFNVVSSAYKSIAQEMQDIITEDDLLKLADTCKFDDYPDFVRERREYASQMGFFMGSDSPAEADRNAALMKQLQQVETPGVPAGLEF